jgi:hypothetical protein
MADEDDRVQTAADVETERVTTAAEVETERVVEADRVEAKRDVLATDLAREVVTAAATLSFSLNELTDRIADINTYGRKNRHYFVLGLSVLFALSCGLGAVALDANGAANTANTLAASNDSTQFATCKSGNTARSVEKVLWDYLLDNGTVANLPTTPAMKSLVSKTFYLRDCRAIK